MKSYFLTILFICINLLSFSQTTRVELNEDIDYLQKVLYTSHPSTFRYISEKDLDSVFSSLKFKEDEEASILNLEKKTRIILSKIGCIHTRVKGTCFKFSKKTMPFDFYVEKDRIWIIKDLEDSLKDIENTEIHSINGNSANTIIDKMLDFKASDGYNTTFKYKLINNNQFSNLYQYYFDKDSIKTYGISQTSYGNIIINVGNVDSGGSYSTGVIDGLYFQQKRKNITYKHKKKKKEEGKYFGDNIWVKFDSVHDLAILKIKSFSGSPYFGKYKNNRRYKKALKLIKKNNYSNLVIDLRDNFGGDAASGNRLLSHFVDSSHFFSIEKKKGKIFKYSTGKSRFGNVLNSLFGNLAAGRRITSKRRKTKSIIKPKKKHEVSGELFVLINGFTSSTASNTASVFKYKTKAKLIGEETGGGANDLNAYYSGIVKLPYSKIKIQIPQYHIDLNLIKTNCSGVVPEIEIEYFYFDIISGKDKDMEAVYRYTDKK